MVKRGRRTSRRGGPKASSGAPLEATLFKEPKSDAIAYRGPIWAPSAPGNADLITTNLIYGVTLSSTAAGLITTTFDQSMTGLTGWANFSALYDEYRVLGCQVEFFPSNRYSKTATFCAPGFAVVDRDSNGALVSAAEALGYSSCRIMTLEDPWTDSKEYRGSSIPSLSWRMDSVLDAQFVTTAAPSGATKPTIKLYFSGLSASTAYGFVIQRVLVQFRGKN
jgi:hypothetical protein